MGDLGDSLSFPSGAWERQDDRMTIKGGAMSVFPRPFVVVEFLRYEETRTRTNSFAFGGAMESARV